MRLKHYFSIICHDENNIELRSGAFNSVSHFLRDEQASGVLSRIVSHLDGRDLGAVAKAANVGRAKVESVVDQLTQLGALEDGPSSALDAYFDLTIPSLRSPETRYEPRMPVTIFGPPMLAQLIESGIRELSPSVEIEVVEPSAQLARDVGSLRLAEFDEALRGAELETRFARLRERLVVVAQSRADPHAALVLNRLALTLKSPMLWGALDGPALFVGPFTLPAGTSCYQCFETRVMMNLREYASYQKYKSALAAGRVLDRSLPIGSALGSILAGHLAMEATNYLLTGSAFTLGKSLCVYLPSMEFTFNDVLRVANCPACGPKRYADEPELYYEIRALVARAEGA